MNERGQRRVIVVVVGVTPHQGDGSAVTGRRITGNFVQSLVSIEVLDLMNDPLRELEHLSKVLTVTSNIIRMGGMRSRGRARQKVTGELGAAKSCLPSSEGAGRRRTSVMKQRAVLRPYLHYAFDMWMRRHWPDIPYERFADDCICHCTSEAQAQALRVAIAARFADCGLELHPDKT